MPSSKYSAEQLTRQIIKAILQLINSSPKPSKGRVVEVVTADLSHLSGSTVNSETQRLLSYLKHRGYIEEQGQQLQVTDKGVRRLQQLQLVYLQLGHGQRWDGKWRVVTFDIPESNRVARDALRRLLKQLGFRRLQQSVWIHPLPCQAQIRYIQDAYGVKKHITLLEVESFDRSAEFRRLFQGIIA